MTCRWKLIKWSSQKWKMRRTYNNYALEKAQCQGSHLSDYLGFQINSDGIASERQAQSATGRTVTCSEESPVKNRLTEPITAGLKLSKKRQEVLFWTMFYQSHDLQGA